MEEAKQKKRNKKKKNKQAKDAVQTSSQQECSNVPDPSHSTMSDESHCLQESHCDGISESPIEENGSLGSGSNGSALETKEKQDWIKEEATLKVMIKELQLERESRIQKAAELETELSKVQVEKDVLQQKEINFEEKKSELMREKDTLCMEETKLLEKVRLLEREKAVWIQEEDSIKQNTAALNEENTRVRVQDASKIDDLNSQIEAACQLVEKLITENADLVEKMNELYTEIGHCQAKDGESAISVPDSLTVIGHATASHFESEYVNGTDLVAGNDNRSDEVLITEERLVTGHSNEDYSDVNGKYPETSVCGEIVQIPLDENETQDLEGQALIQDKIDGIPLSDSPLIGAPFRLISFVAKYVSGADIAGDVSNSVP